MNSCINSCFAIVVHIVLCCIKLLPGTQIWNAMTALCPWYCLYAVLISLYAVLISLYAVLIHYMRCFVRCVVLCLLCSASFVVRCFLRCAVLPSLCRQTHWDRHTGETDTPPPGETDTLVRQTHTGETDTHRWDTLVRQTHTGETDTHRWDRHTPVSQTHTGETDIGETPVKQRTFSPERR